MMLKIIFLTFLSFAYACKSGTFTTTTTTTTTTATTTTSTSTTTTSTTASTTTTTKPTSATRTVNSTTAATKSINDMDINISIGMAIFLIIVIGSISFLLLKNCQKNSQEKQQENIAKDKRNTRRSSSKDKAKRLSASGDYLNYSGVGSTIGCYGPVIKEMTSFDPSESLRKTTHITTNTTKWPEEDIPGPETRVEISELENVVSFKTAKPMLKNLGENVKNDDVSQEIAEIKPSDPLLEGVVSENATSRHVSPRHEKPPRKKSTTVSAYDQLMSQL